MRSVGLRAGMLAVVLLTWVVVYEEPAEAHNPSTFFPQSHIPGLTTKWPFNRVDVYFDPTFPNEQIWRDRVQEAGAVNWPRSIGLPPVHYWFAPSAWTTGPCVRADNQNGVFWQPIPTSFIAITEYCDYFGHWYFNMVFNKNVTLWPGNTSPPSSLWQDLESVATHEWGHAYGWNAMHIAPEGTPQICDYSGTRHTMCAVNVWGWLRQRTPAVHDLHTVDAAYP